MAQKFDFTGNMNAPELAITSLVANLNALSRHTFDVDTENFIRDEAGNIIYHSLEDLYISNEPDTIYPVAGVYLNTKGNYGDSTVIALPNTYLNLPSHLAGVYNEIINNEAFIEAINNGQLGFTIRQYKSRKYNRDNLYSAKWCQIDAEKNYEYFLPADKN